MSAAALAQIAAFLGPQGAAAVASSKPVAAQRRGADCAGEVSARIRVVVFSKDRAFQLRSCLASLLRYVRAAELEVVVIWCASTEERAASVGLVIKEFEGGSVRFEREGAAAGRDFRALVFAALEGVDYVVFCVDDALFYGSVDLDFCARELGRSESALALQLKLCPQISWSQAAGEACPPPASLSLAATKGSTTLLRWRLGDGDYDWNYPWDLCAALYRSRDAREVAEFVDGKNSKNLSQPNRFEAAGAAYVQSCSQRWTQGLCVAAPVLSVLAVNRVQDVYAAPIYENALSLDALNAIKGKEKLDGDHYLRCRPTSVHVDLAPILLVKEEEEEGGKDDEANNNLFERRIHSAVAARKKIKVAFLVPARNAAKTIRRCVASCLAQKLCVASFSLAVVVVDDGSTDWTAEVLKRHFGAEPRVRVVRTAHRSLARALNVGLGLIDADFVARLDADDECFHDRRLQAQLAVILNDDRLAALGGGTLSFQATDDERKTVSSYALRPCDPRLVAWSLLFSCCVAHPTVLFRTSAIKRIGGYSEAKSVRHAEDYDLWLRLTDSDSKTVANVPDPLAWLQKSPESVSSRHRRDQKNAADHAVYAAIARRLSGHHHSRRASDALRRPTDAPDTRALRDAADLLLALETSFLEKERAQLDDRIGPLLRRDVDARLAELALEASRRDPTNDDARACHERLKTRGPDAARRLLAGLCSLVAAPPAAPPESS